VGVEDLKYEELWDAMKADYHKKFGARLQAKVAERDLVKSIENDPPIVRAAWNYYMDDEKSHRYGFSVTKFVDNFNKYVVMMGKKPWEKDGPVQHNELPRYYRCERYDCFNEQICMVRKGTTYPQYWHDPCKFCAGRMVLVDAQEAKNE